jgi:hypothetical protein
MLGAMGRWHQRISPGGWIMICVGIMVLAAIIEFSMGRVLISKSGRILLWVGKVNSSENSQQIADWYSFTHIIHGCFFYAVLRPLRRFGWSVWGCLAAAVLIESAWEVFENTPFVIERYRAATISLDYYGDSVLNSMFDVIFCILGFWLAWKLPVWGTIALVVFIELGLAYAIRDNLMLNIIMLIHPSSAIRHWQMRG